MRAFLRRALIAAALAFFAQRAAADASLIYALDTTGAYSIDSVSGTSTKVTTFTGAFTLIAATAQRASDGMIFFINDNGTGNGQVYSYNPATPTVQPTLLGVTGATVPYLPRMCFDINGTLYAVPINDSNIYTINTTTGAATAGPALTGAAPTAGGDMAFGPDGVLYQVAGTTLYKVPPAGGAITTIGTIASLPENLSGLAFDSTGNLFGLGVETTAPSTIYKIANYATAPTSTTFTTSNVTQGDLGSIPVLLAKLTIAKTGSAGSSIGGLIAYSVTVSNAGPAAANGTKLADPVPTGATVAGTPTCAASGGAVCGTVTVASNTVSSTITTLPSGGSVTFTIDAKATATGSLVNTATQTPPALVTNTGNASASATTVVSAANGVVKTVANITQGTVAGSSDNANPKDVLEYTLTYTNNTGATLSSFQMTDPIPTNTTYVAASAACPTLPATLTCSPALAAGTLTFFGSGGSLAAGATVSVKFRATVN